MAADPVLNLLLPRGCGGCDLPDAVLCPDCRAALGHVLASPLPAARCGRAFACGLYAGPVRHAVLGWKDHGDAELDRPLAAAVNGLAARIGLVTDQAGGGGAGMPMGDAVGAGMGDDGDEDGDAGDDGAIPTILEWPDLSRGPVYVVPAPSSPRSVRRRGRRHLDPVGRALAAAMRRGGAPGARFLPALDAGGVRRKAVEAHGAAARAARVGGDAHGGIQVRRRAAARLDGAPTVLVDDILTTGATLRRCAAALAGAGAVVLTALAIAVAPPPGA